MKKECDSRKIFIRVISREQLQKVLEWGKADALLVDYALWNNRAVDVWDDLLQDVWKESGESPTPIYVSLPDVTRQDKAEPVLAMIQNASGKIGVVIKNLDQLGMVMESAFAGPVITDPFLYAYNSAALRMYLDLIPGLQLLSADELTDAELAQAVKELSPDSVIYKAYGHQLLMITNQCLSKNYGKCPGGGMEIRNERGDRFVSVNRCDQCYSVLYDHRIVSMLDKLDEIPYTNILLDFTIESAQETDRVLDLLNAMLANDNGRSSVTGNRDSRMKDGSIEYEDQESQIMTQRNKHITSDNKGKDHRKGQGKKRDGNQNDPVTRGHHYKGVE